MGSIASASAVPCSQCGTPTAPEDLLTLWGQTVCATCKPGFVRRMQEGTATSSIGVYKGFWIRVLARWLDGLVVGIVTLPVALITMVPALRLVAARQPGASAAYLVAEALYAGSWYVLWIAYYTFFHGRFGATLGKMAIGAKVVNADGTPIGYSKALGRCFADMLSELILCIGFIMAGFDKEKRALHDRICGTRVVAK